MTLCRPLDFHESAGFVHHDIHVGLRLGVFGIVEIEDRGAAKDAHRYRGDPAEQRVFLQYVLSLQALHRKRERHVAAADGRRPGAAVCLEDVAVQGHHTLAERTEVRGSP